MIRILTNPTGMELARFILFLWTLVWFVPLIISSIQVFKNPAYVAMQVYADERHWGVLFGILLAISLLRMVCIYKGYIRLAAIICICLNIIRSGVYAFITVMFFIATPTGLGWEIHLIITVLALWLIWRVADGLNS